MSRLKLNVNGKDYQLEADPELPLLWALRDHLELTGTKYGCGRGLCGSCTVHVDGEATRSCVTTVSEVGSAHIVTIEGLGGRHRVQEAWVAEQVPQCGYCQSGQIMTAVALLSANPAPTADDIDRTMGGVLCRCGTYTRIRRAIQRAAKGGESR